MVSSVTPRDSTALVADAGHVTTARHVVRDRAVLAGYEIGAARANFREARNQRLPFFLDNAT